MNVTFDVKSQLFKQTQKYNTTNFRCTNRTQGHKPEIGEQSQISSI